MNGGDPGIDKRGPVLGAQSHVLVKPGVVLGVYDGGAGDGKRSNAGEQNLPHANLL
jgi:hypothetical protein